MHLWSPALPSKCITIMTKRQTTKKAATGNDNNQFRDRNELLCQHVSIVTSIGPPGHLHKKNNLDPLGPKKPSLSRTRQCLHLLQGVLRCLGLTNARVNIPLWPVHHGLKTTTLQ